MATVATPTNLPLTTDKSKSSKIDLVGLTEVNSGANMPSVTTFNGGRRKQAKPQKMNGKWEMR